MAASYWPSSKQLSARLFWWTVRSLSGGANVLVDAANMVFPYIGSQRLWGLVVIVED